MSLTYALDELLTYSNHERKKWQAWVAHDPTRLAIPFQPGARFPTIGALLDHIVLVERRHLSRLEGATPPDATGIPATDWAALFDYAELVRADLSRFATDLNEPIGNETMTVTVPSGSFEMTRRKLTLHILLHEIRHLAQIAFAARAAGHEPPGEHDLFYCAEVK